MKHYFVKVFFLISPFRFTSITDSAANSCKLSPWNLRPDVRMLAKERLEPAELPRNPSVLTTKELGLQTGWELLKFLHRAHVSAVMRCTGCEKNYSNSKKTQPNKTLNIVKVENKVVILNILIEKLEASETNLRVSTNSFLFNSVKTDGKMVEGRWKICRNRIYT